MRQELHSDSAFPAHLIPKAALEFRQIGRHGSLRGNLMQNNKEYRRLKHEHEEYSKRLTKIRARRFPTPAEQSEEIQLKKVKLQLKDRMQRLQQQHSEAG